MTRSARICAALAFLTHLGATAFAQVQIGSQAVALWEDDGLYYFGTPVEYNDTVRGGTYLVVFEDGSQALVPTAKVAYFRLTVGTAVYAPWDGAGSYPGRVARILGNAVYVIFDGGEGWTSMGRIALDPRTVGK